MEWFAQVKFSECCNIIKFGKVTGAFLAQQMQQGDSYMEQNLGIEGDNEKLSFRTKFNKALQSKLIEVSLYGWGQNDRG